MERRGQQWDLRQQGLTDAALHALLAQVNVQEVRRLDLSGNRLARPLPEGLRNVTEINIEDNLYTSLDWLAQFTKLERVRVQRNPLPDDLKRVVLYRLADICPTLNYVNGEELKPTRSALPWIRHSKEQALRQACDSVLPDYFQGRLPRPDAEYSDQELTEPVNRIRSKIKSLLSSLGLTLGRQLYALYLLEGEIEPQVRAFLTSRQKVLHNHPYSSCHMDYSGEMDNQDERERQKRTAAAADQERLERRQMQEEKLRQREERRYSTWRSKGALIDLHDVPTCCDCFDNCGSNDTVFSIADLPRKRFITLQAMEEYWQELFRSGIDRTKLSWEWLQEAPTPLEVIPVEIPSSEGREVEAPAAAEASGGTTESVDDIIQAAGAQLGQMKLTEEREVPMEVDYIRQPLASLKRRKKPNPIRNPWEHQRATSADDDFGLDLNAPAIEKDERTWLDRIKDLPFASKTKYATLVFEPLILKRSDDGRYLVSYQPEDMYVTKQSEVGTINANAIRRIPNAWVTEEEARRPVEKCLTEISALGLRKIMLACSDV